MLGILAQRSTYEHKIIHKGNPKQQNFKQAATPMQVADRGKERQIGPLRPPTPKDKRNLAARPSNVSARSATRASMRSKSSTWRLSP